MKTIILKISKDTNYVKAATSIVAQVLNESPVSVDVIGTAANYTAAKTFIQTIKDLTVYSISVSFAPRYVNIMTVNGEKTAIRWDVVKIK